MAKGKLIEVALDLAAIAADLEAALSDILGAADGDAAADVADDGAYTEAHQLIGQVPLMRSGVDKDSFAIRAHRAMERAMRLDFRRIAGDAVRRRVMPEHARIRQVRERLRALCAQMEGKR